MTVWPDGSSTMPELTSPYGGRWLDGKWVMHNGADFVGFPTIRAVEGGVVRFAGWNDLMGHIVYASHADDAYRTRSCHMAYPAAVRTGEAFHQGDMFGVPGNTGSESRGVHLHFDVYLLGSNGWYRTDPVAFLRNRMSSFAGGNSTPLEDIMNADQEKKLDTVLSRAGWVKDRLAGSVAGTSVTDLLRTNIAVSKANSAAIAALAGAKGIDVQPILDAIDEAAARPVNVEITAEQQEAIADAVAARVTGTDAETVKTAVREVMQEAFN